METVTFTYNTWMGAGERDLMSGHVCEDAKDVFLSGHCHNFALAAMELRPEEDWKLVGVWHSEQEHGEWIGGELEHVALEISDGIYLDVRGTLCEDGLVEDFYGKTHVAELDYADLEAEVEAGHYRPWAIEETKTFAQVVLEEEGL